MKRIEFEKIKNEFDREIARSLLIPKWYLLSAVERGLVSISETQNKITIEVEKEK